MAKKNKYKNKNVTWPAVDPQSNQESLTFDSESGFSKYISNMLIKRLKRKSELENKKFLRYLRRLA